MNTKQTLRYFATLLLLLLMCFGVGAAQDQRDIEAKEVLQGRRQRKQSPPGRQERYRVRQPAPPVQPSVVARNKPSGKKVPPKPVPLTATARFPVGPLPPDKAYLTLGLTLWSVGDATPAQLQDPQALIERMTWSGQVHQALAQRMAGDTSVTDPALIQMSVEYLPAAQSEQSPVGYLYVINCEQYADGTCRNMKLIFPTKQTYGGDNSLRRGQTVTLPGPNRPFRITRSAGQQYETYLLILSPEPLPLPQDIGKEAMLLPSELVGQWQQQWGTGDVRADLLGKTGQPRTPVEVAANGKTDENRGTEDTADDLTQDDAPPQMIFRKAVTRNEALMVAIRLPFRP